MEKLLYIKPLSRFSLAVVAGVGLVFASYTAQAEPSIYIGGAYGMARVDGGNFDDDSPMIKGFIGGKFNHYIGLEAAANDYGEAKGSGYKTQLSGYTVALMGYLPLGENADIFAKIGKLWWQNDYNILGYSNDATGNDVLYGFGLQLNLNESLAFRLEMERYQVEFSKNEVGLNFDETYDVDVASVGLVLTF
jgi:OmpA-OmpF porin, OOP family